MSFQSLDLHPKILQALSAAGYVEPTAVQVDAIPKIMKGFDTRASAQTGTGKTAAFLLPLVNRLITPSSKPGKGPRTLILVPVRELAQQIDMQAKKYTKYLQHIKTTCVVGGVSYHAQIRKLVQPCDILIATPGRLIDLMKQKKVNFSRLEMFVLDEADRMLDMGFTEPVKEIVKTMPPSRQTLLFSATLEGSVMKLSESIMNNPLDIVVHAKHAKHANIDQRLHYVDDLRHKNSLLDHILSTHCVEHTIIFTSTKRFADQLAKELHDKGYQTAALHGDMNQRRRSETIMKLRKGKIKILVATDVAARGIDVQSITHVINFDLSRNVEDYVHRIGRTGRVGAKGTALTFATRGEESLVKKIEKFTGQPINIVEIAGLEPRKQNNRRRAKRSPHSLHPRAKGRLRIKPVKKAAVFDKGNNNRMSNPWRRT